MKFISLSLAWLLFAGICFAAETVDPAKETDPQQEERWKDVQKLLKTHPETDHKVDKDKYGRELDEIWHVLRRKGLEFWDAYPQDARRYLWFNAMENRGFVSNYRYHKFDFDAEELKNWRARRPELRAEFLASPHVTADQRVTFRYNELRFDILAVTGTCSLGGDLDPVRTSKLTVESVAADILDYADTHPAPEELTSPRVKVGRYPVDAMNLLVGTYLRGDTPESRTLRDNIARRMIASKHPAMRQYGEQALATWSAQNLSVAGRTLTGDDFNLENHRGKLVLIDCWATWCAPCISELPELRKMSERFGPQGLALVGVSLDPAANREKVMGILKSAGATWPQITEGNALARRLGCRSVPHVVLVGRNGKEIASGSFSLRELEKLIEQNLAPSESQQ